MIKNLRKGQLLYFFQPSEGRLWVLNFQCGLLGGLIALRSCRSPNPQSIYRETFWVFRDLLAGVQKRHVVVLFIDPMWSIFIDPIPLETQVST